MVVVRPELAEKAAEAARGPLGGPVAYGNLLWRMTLDSLVKVCSLVWHVTPSVAWLIVGCRGHEVPKLLRGG